MLRFLYSSLLHAVLPLAVLRLFWLGVRDPRYVERWWERFGRITLPEGGAPVIWIHAVSVGEVVSSGPLIERLRMAFPGFRYLITTVTPTGAEMVTARFDSDVWHAYFPYDLPWVVSRFLAAIRPRMVVVMETEIWPNLYSACRRAGIPLLMVNARVSPRSFSGYLRFAGLAGGALRCVAYVAAQTRVDADRFRALGVPADRLGICGNLKFDIQISRSVNEQGQALRRAISNDRLIWVAASTHEGEEAVLLEAFRQVLGRFPACLLILAPRHPNRFEAVAGLCGAWGFHVVRRSTRQPVPAAAQIFLLDSLGELLPFYACSDLAFVGGSLVPAGGHNMLEPSGLGIPVLTGPHTFNFTEIMHLLADAGAVSIVRNAAEIAGRVIELLGDANLRHAKGEAARCVFDSNKGAADRVVRVLAGVVGDLGSGAATGSTGRG